MSDKESKRSGYLVALIVILAAFTLVALYPPGSLFQTWLIGMLLLTAFILVAGKGVSGKSYWTAAFIDRRNKMSLSRLQMLLWTVVVLSFYCVVAIARVGEDPASALDFEIPNTLLLLMAISTTSMVGSPLVKSTRGESLTGLDFFNELNVDVQHAIEDVDTFEAWATFAG